MHQGRLSTRALPVEEWPRLRGTEAETVWPYLDPSKTMVMVVENDQQIVGCHVLVFVLHAECLWIHPDYRGKASVGRRLWAAVCKAARATGARTLVTAAMDQRVRALLAHVGAQRLPGQHYAIPMEKKD